MVKKGIFIALGLSAILLIVGIIISTINKRVDNYCITVKQAYSAVYDDEAIIRIPVYYSKENKLFDASNINEASISNTQTKIVGDLKSVEDSGKRIYNGASLYARIYEISFKGEFNVLIKDACLNLSASNSKYSLKIGSVSLRHYKKLGESKELTINKASVLAKSGTIEALCVSLESKEELIIKNIMVDNASVFVDLNNIKKTNTEYSEVNSIKDVINNYNIYTKQPNFKLDEFKLNGEVNIVIPLKYIDNVIFLSSPIIIEYEINGISDVYVLDDFQYVNHLYNIIDLGGIEKCQL